MSLSLLNLLSLTCSSLRANPLRSALTSLGVFMGVAAVSATLQVGSISRAILAEQLSQRGAPNVMVFPTWQAEGPPTQLRSEDLEYLKKRLTGLKAISASEWVGSANTVFEDREANPFMTAVSQEFLLTYGKQLVAGRFFTPADFESYRPVVVIDQFLADQLFQGTEAIGKRIYADSRPYIIVGVLPTDQSWGREPEGQLLITMSVYSAMTGSRDVGILRLRPHHQQDLEDLGLQAEQMLQQRFSGARFSSWNNIEDILTQQQILQMASLALSAVGVISLLVGGVGIANITIAAVMERTTEIGLRRALGATQVEIMLQFILEAALLSLLGGTVALVSVHGLTVVVANTLALPYQFELSTASFALGSALLVGVGAGFLPAIRASKLDPVKALRSS
ncbi:MAG: ABC transporter permease [Symploca sp. SIO2E9]|nr:ABC transporter permease [Symploca sp. SIO2E9]